MTAGLTPRGSHSQTWPPSNSSQESHVPQGVAPPAQFTFVPPRMRCAATILPLASKRMELAPPPLPGVSLFET